MGEYKKWANSLLLKMLIENRRARDSLVSSKDPVILTTFTKGGRLTKFN